MSRVNAPDKQENLKILTFQLIYNQWKIVLHHQIMSIVLGISSDDLFISSLLECEHEHDSIVQVLK